MELLTVIGIIALIMVIGIPSFLGMGKGAGMRTAVGNLKAKMSLARQWAITHREKTYVVFPTTNITNVDSKASYRAYTVYTSSAGFISEWTFLPVGVVFNPSNAPTKNVFAVGVSSVPGLAIANISSLVFNPDGSAQPANDPEVYLSEGGNDPTFLIRPYSLTNGVQIISLTGTTKINDYNIR